MNYDINKPIVYRYSIINDETLKTTTMIKKTDIKRDEHDFKIWKMDEFSSKDGML